MNSETKKPNFFIVGAPKCGTTSLHYYLSQHPEIFMSEPKEPHYFCKDFHEETKKFHGKLFGFGATTEEEFLELFKNVKNEKIIGEASAMYLYSKVAAKEIYKFNPSSKILISIREPVEFLYSYYLELYYCRGEDIDNFKKAIQLEEERKKGYYLPKTVAYPSALFYSEVTKFSVQIERYLKIFPREQVKIILLDDLKNNLEGTYKEILIFLGVDDIDFRPDFTIKNPAKTYRSKFLQDLLKNPYKMKKIVNIYRKIVPLKIREKIYNFLLEINKKPIKKPAIDPEFRHELMIKFKPEVEKLSDLLNRDLISLWGYDKI
ncbi:sulfotransferase [Methanocaldococcus sp. 10A]